MKQVTYGVPGAPPPPRPVHPVSCLCVSSGRRSESLPFLRWQATIALQALLKLLQQTIIYQKATMGQVCFTAIIYQKGRRVNICFLVKFWM